VVGIGRRVGIGDGYSDAVTYSERLRPPVLWWIVFGLVAMTFVVAVAVFLSSGFVLAALVVAVAVEIAVMLSFSARITVSAEGVRAGRAVLEWPYVGVVTCLTRDEVRLRYGRDADPRAYVLYKSYADEAVEITLEDHADPHPYWLLSTSDAAALAGAIEKAKVVA
jgi:hypothetical protein